MKNLSKLILFSFVFANLGLFPSLIPLKVLASEYETFIPDLMVSSVSFSPREPYMSETYTGSLLVIIKNQGNLATNYAEGVRVSASMRNPDGTLIGNLGTFDGLKYASNLDAGASATVDIGILGVKFTDGVTINLYLDNTEQGGSGFILESDETNNTFEKKYSFSSKPNDSTFEIIGHVSNMTPISTTPPSIFSTTSQITSISPISGLPYTEVIILGKGFQDPCTGKSPVDCQAVVFFGNAAVDFMTDTIYHISWTDEKIVTRVPYHAVGGNVRVYRNEFIKDGVLGDHNTTLNVSGPIFSVTNNTNNTKKSEDAHLEEIKKTTEYVSDSKYDALLAEINALRSQVKEQEAEIKYLKSLTFEVKNISESMKSFMTNFVTYGVDDNTKKLGEGERAAVLNSFKGTYGKLPETDVEVEDTIKIANGRFPSMRIESVEQEAEKIFEHVYGRKSDEANTSDQNFIMVVSYGLRQKAENRKLETETKALTIYKGIYKQLPQNTEDWNILQGIAYSGAKR